MQDSFIGQSFSHRPQQQVYRKIKVLGEGAMGKAYLVESRQDQNLYVMKRINIGHLSNQEKQNAMREAKLHSIVSHPYIIGFKQIYHTTKDKLCIIMQYAEGGDLDELIKRQNGLLLSEDAILNYFTQICLGLNQIHSKKIIHRDIKGANIFLTKEKIVKIGDFGISKVIDQTMQASKTFVGTPYYLSPQMIEGKPYSTKADIWSLGVLLYHLCSQKLPFDANSLPLLALKILRGAFPPLKGPFSRQLKSLVLSLLQVNSNKRPSIKEILIKPFLAKYVPKEELQTITISIKQQKQKMKIKPHNTVKPTVKELSKKTHGIIEEQKIKREQAREKRDQMRKEMREDLKSKRKQCQKVKTQSIKNIQIPENLTQMAKNKSKKSLDVVENLKKDKQLSKPIQKPWKLAKKGNNSNKQIEVELFVPNNKKKQKKVEPVILPEHDFKVQIFVGPRNTSPDINNMEKLEQEQEENNDEQILSQEQVMQEISEGQQNKQMNLQDMLAKVNYAQKAVNGLGNPYITQNIQLYEESQTFDSNEILVKNKEKMEQKNQPMKYISNMRSAQNLEECRQVLQSALGQQNFIKAYHILRQHLEDSQNKDLRGQDLDDYTFNRQVIRSKMDFIPQETFNGYIVLMYTLLILEDEQMKQNFDSDEDSPK